MELQHFAHILETATLLYDECAIGNALDSLAEKINRDYINLNPIFMVVMNGGLIFAGKLLPKLTVPMQVDYCHATRYRNETSGCSIEWKVKPRQNICGRHVILVDDILDQGQTLQAIIDQCLTLRAASVKTAVMIEKCHSRKASKGMKPDYCELQAPDEYLFGCGMDYKGYCRNTGSIYILDKKFYSKPEVY